MRVTGVGVEAVVDGCTKLEMFDVSQCKNLQKWLDGGGEERSRRRYGRDGRRRLRFEVSKASGVEGSLR